MTADKILRAIAYLNKFNKEVDDSRLEASDRIKSKLIIERIVYFLQEFGAKIGYIYGWWSFGPYSNEFSDDIIEFSASREKTELIEKNSEFNAEEKKIVKKCKAFMSELIGENKDQEKYWLDLACIVHFLHKYHHEHLEDISSFEKILSKLAPNKYQTKEVEEVWSSLKRHELVTE